MFNTRTSPLWLLTSIIKIIIYPCFFSPTLEIRLKGDLLALWCTDSYHRKAIALGMIICIYIDQVLIINRYTYQRWGVQQATLGQRLWKEQGTMAKWCSHYRCIRSLWSRRHGKILRRTFLNLGLESSTGKPVTSLYFKWIFICSPKQWKSIFFIYNVCQKSWNTCYDLCYRRATKSPPP